MQSYLVNFLEWRQIGVNSASGNVSHNGAFSKHASRERIRLFSQPPSYTSVPKRTRKTVTKPGHPTGMPPRVYLVPEYVTRSRSDFFSLFSFSRGLAVVGLPCRNALTDSETTRPGVPQRLVRP